MSIILTCGRRVNTPFFNLNKKLLHETLGPEQIKEKGGREQNFINQVKLLPYIINIISGPDFVCISGV